ncbi:MAG: glycosyltransferase [Pseudomonadota bacterium]
MSRVLFYCQSSLGIGHTVRSLRIAAGLSHHFDLHFLNGGESIKDLRTPPGIHMCQLPAITSDPEFTSLRPADPALSLEQAFTRRRDLMLDSYARLSPEILLVELYPFGRRQFGPELKPLLKRARSSGSRIVCSLRDILVTRRDQAAYETKVVDLMNRFFDLLLVHSDPGFQPLHGSFSRLDEIQAEIAYTGYVVPEITADSVSSSKTIIASIGGGRFGHELAEAVVRSAPLLARRIPHQIRLYTGPFCPDPVADRLRGLARGQANIRVERFTPDLHQKLAGSDLSISMGGYNTTMNVLATGVRAMLMGCTNNGGMDQVERVEKLAELGVVEVIRADDLEPGRFADKVVRALEREPAPANIDLDGVGTTVSLLQKLLHSSDNPPHKIDKQQCLA